MRCDKVSAANEDERSRGRHELLVARVAHTAEGDAELRDARRRRDRQLDLCVVHVLYCADALRDGAFARHCREERREAGVRVGGVLVLALQKCLEELAD